MKCHARSARFANSSLKWRQAQLWILAELLWKFYLPQFPWFKLDFATSSRLECHCTNWVKVEIFPQKIEDLHCTDSPNVCSLFLQANGDLALFIYGISCWDWLWNPEDYIMMFVHNTWGNLCIPGSITNRAHWQGRAVQWELWKGHRGTLSSAGAARSCPPISAGLGSAPDPAIPSPGEDAGHGPGDLVAQWSQVLAAPSPSKLGWFRAGFKSLCPGPWALQLVLGHTSLLWVWIPVFGHFCPFCALCSSRGSLYQSPPH